MFLQGFAFSAPRPGSGRSTGHFRAFVIAAPERERAARERFKEYFGVEPHQWDEAFEHDHTIITAADEAELGY